MLVCFRQPVYTCATHAWSHKLKFPYVDFKKIASSPPKELLIFEDTNDADCPTVLWFTLCNAKFRNASNYKPRFSKGKKRKNIKKLQKLEWFNLSYFYGQCSVQANHD